MSFLHGSETTATGGTTSHVPSMQDFAAFKAAYGNAVAWQAMQEAVAAQSADIDAVSRWVNEVAYERVLSA